MSDRFFFTRELEELKDAQMAMIECIKIVRGDFDEKIVGKTLPDMMIVEDIEEETLMYVIYGARLRALVDLQKTINNILLIRIEEANVRLGYTSNLVGPV